YKGLELTLSKRMSNRWQLLGSYVWSRLEGDQAVRYNDAPSNGSDPAAGDPNNPNTLINANGRGNNDQPHAFKLIGSYQAPWGINLGANYQALSGLPRNRILRVSLTQGATDIRADPSGTYRADFLNLLSFRADKSFKLGGGHRASFIAEAHNLLN